ncbi:hypothetical protein GCM10011379_34690 [Filimonas zeae]|uniref:Secretion system C-terminal sorting domain-containing protein n=1 Tax=Filimonas zeae TaxID=1737353 RepID=A0A917MX96_9BACT|nr:hypothetical protein GCM10011379_34690 [Filimonas zeae]
MQYTYDAAGNLIKREYVCNNAPSGGRLAGPQTTDTAAATKETTEVQLVEALYPNPTTGLFRISFVKPLNNAVVRLFDNNGRLLKQYNASGSMVPVDISTFIAGLYYIVVTDKDFTVRKKIIKL